MTSAMSRTEHQSTIEVEKYYTSFKWTFKDWTLLHSSYYNAVLSSPEFVLNNTGGCKCQLTLVPYYVDGTTITPKSGCVQIELYDEVDFYTMQASVSLLDGISNKKFTVQSDYRKPFPTPATIKLGMNFTKREVSDYLINDTLILLFELTIVKSINVSPLQTEIYKEPFSTGMRVNLQKIRDNRSLCDVTFVIGEKRLNAHKVILAVSSPVFEAMFTSGMKEQKEDEVHIVDIEATVFEAFLNYMYTGQVSNLKTMAGDLIVVADKYQMPDLQDICENFMSSHLDHAHVIKYLLTADKLDCTVLKAKAIQFIKANMKVLANAADYKMLFDYPELIKIIFDQ